MLLVPAHPTIEDVREAAFECSPGFSPCLALVEFALVIDAAGPRVAGLADGDGVQHGIELTITTGVEPVVQRCQRDGPGIVGIGFASAAGAQDPDFHCQGGRNVNDVLTTRDQNLRYATAESLCSLDRVLPFWPSSPTIRRSVRDVVRCGQWCGREERSRIASLPPSR